MALDFPASPSLGQQFTAGGSSWTWDGVAWNMIPQMMPAVPSDTPPPNPGVGQLWWRALNGQLYIYVDDGNSKQWVQAGGAPMLPVDPYPFFVADMQLRSVSAGNVALNNKKDGTGTDIATFTTGGNLTVTGSVFSNQNFVATTGNAILAPAATGVVALRPNGPASTSGQLSVASNGNVYAAAGLFTNAGSGGPSIYTDATANTLGFTGNYAWQELLATGNVRLVTNGSTRATYQVDGAYVLTGRGWQPGGGVWADTSDARIKNVLGNYDSGLNAVRALQPVRYTFKGNDTRELPHGPLQINGAGQFMDPEPAGDAPYANSGHYQAALDKTQYVGLIAQDTEGPMPELVTKMTAYLDGKKVTDLRNLDTGPLIFALINAIKELATRVEVLEARP